MRSTLTPCLGALLLASWALALAAQPEPSHRIDRAQLLPGITQIGTPHLAATPDNHLYVLERANWSTDLDADFRVNRQVSDEQVGAGTSLMFLAEYDAEDGYVQHRNFVSPGNHVPRALQFGADGFLYALVEFSDSLDFGDPALPNLLTAPGPGQALVKLTADLTPVLAEAVPAAAVVTLSDINADGTLLLTGQFTGTLDLDPSPGAEILLTSRNGGTRASAYAATYSFEAGLTYVAHAILPEAAHSNITSSSLSSANEIVLAGYLTGFGLASDETIGGRAVSFAAGDNTLYPAALTFPAVGGAAEALAWYGTANNRRGTFSSALKLPHGDIYVSGRADLTRQASVANLAQFTADGTLLRRYESTDAIARLYRRGDTEMVLTMPASAAWRDKADDSIVLPSEPGLNIPNSGIVSIIDTALSLVAPHVLPSTNLISAYPDGDLLVYGRATAGNTVFDATGELPFVFHWDGVQGEGYYSARYTTDCEPVSNVMATIDLRTCGIIGGATSGYLDGSASGTGLRYQWVNDDDGDPLFDVGTFGDRFIIRGAATPLLYRSSTIAQGYGANVYRLRVADGCGNVLDAPNTSTLYLLGPPLEDGGKLVQPTSKARGESVTFTAEASRLYPDSLLEYQWYKGAFALLDNSKYAGVSEKALTINALDFDDDGTYTAEIRVEGCDYNTRGAYGAPLRIDGYSVLKGENPPGRISLWPNPTTGPIRVGNASEQPLTGELRIVDRFGRVHHRLSNVSIEANDAVLLEQLQLPEGLYHLEIADDSGISVQSLLVNARP